MPNESSRRCLITPFDGHAPAIDPEAWVDVSARIIGRVVLEAGVTVWPGAVLRADDEEIRVGRGSALLDLCLLEAPKGHPVIVEAGALVSHQACLHGAVVRSGALVGIGATVLDGLRWAQAPSSAPARSCRRACACRPGCWCWGLRPRWSGSFRRPSASWSPTSSPTWRPRRPSTPGMRISDFVFQCPPFCQRDGGIFSLLQCNRVSFDRGQAGWGMRRSAPPPIFQVILHAPSRLEELRTGRDGSRLRGNESSGAVRTRISGIAAVRWIVESMAAARCGAYPTPPVREMPGSRKIRQPHP